MTHMNFNATSAQVACASIPSGQVLTRSDAPAESTIKIASLDSAVLFKGQKVIQIEHNGAVYRLQATKLGKLILTK